MCVHASLHLQKLWEEMILGFNYIRRRYGTISRDNITVMVYLCTYVSPFRLSIDSKLGLE